MNVRKGWPPQPKMVALIVWAITGWIALPVALVYTPLVYGMGALVCK